MRGIPDTAHQKALECARNASRVLLPSVPGGPPTRDETGSFWGRCTSPGASERSPYW